MQSQAEKRRAVASLFRPVGVPSDLGRDRLDFRVCPFGFSEKLKREIEDLAHEDFFAPKPLFLHRPSSEAEVGLFI